MARRSRKAARSPRLCAAASYRGTITGSTASPACARTSAARSCRSSSRRGACEPRGQWAVERTVYLKVHFTRFPPTERYRSGRNGGASKASCRATGTWVRIPPSPPTPSLTLGRWRLGRASRASRDELTFVATWLESQSTPPTPSLPLGRWRLGRASRASRDELTFVATWLESQSTPPTPSLT